MINDPYKFDDKKRFTKWVDPGARAGTGEIEIKWHLNEVLIGETPGHHPVRIVRDKKTRYIALARV